MKRRFPMAECQESDWFLEPEEGDLQVQIISEKRDQSLTIPSHSLMLKRASNVFKTMLDDEKKFKESVTKVVELHLHGDIKDGLCFMRYLHSKNLGRQDLSSYLALMQSAHLYEIQDLLEECEEQLQNLVSPYSVCKICSTVGNFVSEAFRKLCYDMMLKSAFLIFSNNFHLVVEEDTMELLLKSDSLNVVNEEQTLAALWEWGCFKSVIENKSAKKDDIKKTTSNLLPFIRWSLIKDVPKKGPLKAFYEENTTNETSCDRQVSNILFLNKFANVISVLRQSTEVKDCVRFDLGHEGVLVTFVPKQRLYFLGFNIHLISKCQTFFPFEDFLPYKIFFNGEDATNLISLDNLIASTTPFNKEFYNYKICIECTTPLYVSSDNICCITIEARANNIYFPSCSVVPCVSEHETSDIILACETVIGITDLFFFPEKGF